MPFVYIVSSDKIDLNFTIVFCISGFYIYIINILYTTLNNNDMIKRTAIFEGVNIYINF